MPTENSKAPVETQQLRSPLEITHEVLSHISAPAEEIELRSPLEIAQDLQDCLAAELQHIDELRSILIAVWQDPDATAHIRNITGAGIDASRFVSTGLEVLVLAFKEELAMVIESGCIPQHAEGDPRASGGEA